MQSDWSAKRTCRELASAVECTATVSTPNSRAARMMRRAISPRFAMRIRWNTWLPPRPRLGRLEAEERLAVLDRAAVLDEHLHQPAGLLGLDLVHQLHRLDDAEHLALLHRRAHAHEGGILRRGGSIEGAH